MRTVAELRPPRLYSVLSTTIGSLPCMITLPARISWASFMSSVPLEGPPWTTAPVIRTWGEKPPILAFRLDESDQPRGEVCLCPERVAPAQALCGPGGMQDRVAREPR